MDVLALWTILWANLTGHDNFQVRQLASFVLVVSGEDRIMWQYIDHSDLEIAHRVRNAREDQPRYYSDLHEQTWRTRNKLHSAVAMGIHYKAICDAEQSTLFIKTPYASWFMKGRKCNALVVGIFAGISLYLDNKWYVSYFKWHGN